jgi:hypothetical protein
MFIMRTMDRRFAFGLALILAAVTAMPAAAGEVPRRLFVFGDSMATGTAPYLPHALPKWHLTQDTEDNRRARDAAGALRDRGERLSPVVHLSLGTGDDPRHPRRFRRAVRRAMSAAGPERCVVWANIFRPAPRGYPRWARLNRVLDREARARENLVIVDWYSLAQAHHEWLSREDGTHVNEEGYRRRAELVAEGVRECRARLEAAAAVRNQ